MSNFLLSVSLLATASLAAPNNRCIFLCDDQPAAGYSQPMQVPQFSQPIPVQQYAPTYVPQPHYGGLGSTGGRYEDFGTVPVSSGRHYGSMNQAQPETFDQHQPIESSFSHTQTSFNHQATSMNIRYPVPAPKPVVVQEPIRQYPCPTPYTNPCY